MEVVFLVAFLFISLSFVLYLYTVLWLRPQRILHVLKKQGIDGPRPRFLSGNLSEMRRMTLMAAKNIGGDDHPMNQDYAKTLFPYMYQWRKTYGQTFVFFVGRRASVYVSQTDIVREMSLRVSTDLGKATHLRKIQKPLFGGGILKSNGSEWAHQRKTIAPEFYMDKVKGMMELMVKSAIPLLKSWEERVEREGGTADIDIGNDLQNFSADVISRACFGGSYSKGKEIFEKIRALSQFISTKRKLFEITDTFLPTKSNREVQRLEGEIRSLILHVVRERMEESTCEDDLLRSILENADINHVGSSDSVDSFIVDNCKNIYFAGHETTAVAATWCLMLLSFYPEWQDRARAEVMEVCRGQPPNANMIHNMKTLTMVIQETLRLYPPSPLVVRETFRDMRFGKFHFPKGVDLWIPTSTMHHDPALWGSDADEFRPERFAHGVSGACRHPNAYLPFGFGARTCLGQNFAMVELKVVLSLLLSRLTFSPSPKYRHSPAFRLIIAPEFGMQLTVKKLSQ
ncbi:SPX domain-containing membrane protein-like [Iris pallida]|uniref:SPX domain-containing membrane protein-like n=1 Tax=Iris pallida TaxID=29817 RepID=A0AAX6HMK2_IRIPA|nr:SPX domain-containing membrane protein-like [Iris pallida]